MNGDLGLHQTVMHTCCSSNSPPLPATNVSTTAASHCHLSPADEERMITFLCSKKNAAVDGVNFRLAVWNALVTEMALYHETGVRVTAPSDRSVTGTEYGVGNLAGDPKLIY